MKRVEDALRDLFDVANGKREPLEVLGLKASDAERLAGFGLSLLDAGKNDDAEACGRVATALDASSFTAWLVLACACARKGQESAALLAYEQALKLDPKHTRAWVDLAELYIQRLDYPRAGEALRKAMALDPDGRTAAGKRAKLVVVNTLLTLEGD